MAEENKRGRKPKTEEQIPQQEPQDFAKMFEEMQKQIASLQKQLEESNNKIKETSSEKSDLEKLVAMLKEDNREKQLPKKVKVMSLLPNKYNLTTEEGGRGKIFTFENFGDFVTMKTSELEEILSIQKYREQAENGYFYILDKDIVADQDLTDNYKYINDKNTIENIIYLKTDECVDLFCGLEQEMRESIATKMAELICDGYKLDRNRLADISMKCDVDIEKIASSLKKMKK